MAERELTPDEQKLRARLTDEQRAEYERVERELRETEDLYGHVERKLRETDDLIERMYRGETIICWKCGGRATGIDLSFGCENGCWRVHVHV